ncbi:MAG TPA: hypothetical protein VFS05_07275 [Gemmatimonadaceae bacterium]|nr:hypothetical protein [Gemmatimonadaceae bacterium]
MSAPLPQDKSAGFTGLVVAVVFLLGTIYGIVQYTNAKYAGHNKGAAAEATH